MGERVGEEMIGGVIVALLLLTVLVLVATVFMVERELREWRKDMREDFNRRQQVRSAILQGMIDGKISPDAAGKALDEMKRG